MPRQWIEDCRTVNCKHLHRNKALFFQTQVSVGEFIAAVENGSFYNKTTHGEEVPYFFGPLKLMDGEYAQVYKIVKKLFPENLFRRKNSNRQWYWNAIVYWEFVHRTIDYRFQKNMVLQWVYSGWVDLNYLFVFYGDGNTGGNARVCHSSGAYSRGIHSLVGSQ